MGNVYLTADHHFGHANLLRFTDKAGAYFRGDKFSSVEEMDEYMISRWNAVVTPQDKVYHLGDFTMLRGSCGVGTYASRLNGKKILIKGNHDQAKIRQYAEWFKDVRATHLLPSGSADVGHLVLSHVPLHSSSLGSWVNVHGHLHEKDSPDGPYLSVCVEKHDYAPVSLDVVVDMARNLQQM